MAKRKEDMNKWLMAHLDEPEAKNGARPHWTKMLRSLQESTALKSWFIKKMLTERDETQAGLEEEKPPEPVAVLIDELLSQWENEAGKAGKASAEIADLERQIKGLHKQNEEFCQMIEGYQAKEREKQL